VEDASFEALKRGLLRTVDSTKRRNLGDTAFFLMKYSLDCIYFEWFSDKLRRERRPKEKTRN